MEYTINELARMAGISTRTLRYYDQVGLLSPARLPTNGYRIYGPAEVDKLQQILFFRALGVSLDEIGRLLKSPDFDRETTLKSHLTALVKQREQLDRLIKNVSKTIDALKGGTSMDDQEKFEGLKQQWIRENETAYGEEIRERFGDEAMEASSRKVQDMSREQWENARELSEQINAKLKLACEQGDAESALAREVCDLHKQWLCLFWKDGSYSVEKHLALAQMYVADDRFKAYYDAILPGAAEFLLKALTAYRAG